MVGFRIDQEQKRSCATASAAVLIVSGRNFGVKPRLKQSEGLFALPPGCAPHRQDLCVALVQCGDGVVVLPKVTLQRNGVELEHARESPCDASAVLAGKSVVGKRAVR